MTTRQPWTSATVSGLCLLVFVALSHIVSSAAACPRECFCPQHSNNVYCSRKHLPAIPVGIPFDTIQLNLNDNNFINPVLSRRNFTNLSNLEHLYLSDCGIKTISLDTFGDLHRLKWLDISKNDIEFIADFTFRGLDMDHLFLNDNPRIEFSSKAFEGLTLGGLYMHRCGLETLSQEVMKPLDGSLLALWLDENSFEKFPFSWLQNFNLSHLRLGNNPFHCNCEITWLYNYFTKDMSVFSGGVVPGCDSPTPHRSKPFNKLTAEDFRCELPTFNNVEAVFDSGIARLTCNASGDPTPSMYWIYPDGTTETFYPPDDDTVRNNAGSLYVADPKFKGKSVYKCVANNPAGNVTFTLDVVWPTRNIEQTTRVHGKGTTGITIPSIIRDVEIAPHGDDSYTHQKKQAMSDPHSVQVEGDFTIVDLVGAVVGTFLLTLLVCAVVFHFYYKRKERLKYQEEKIRNDKKRSPNNLYNYMAEPDENCLKMINHTNDTSIPS